MSIREGQRKTISCSGGNKINIISAIYGKAPRCASTRSSGIVKKNCNGKSSCALYASNSVFGDPCGGIVKELVVKHKCIEGKIEKKIEYNLNHSNHYDIVRCTIVFTCYYV